jgi:hypothetical protein
MDQQPSPASAEVDALWGEKHIHWFNMKSLLKIHESCVHEYHEIMLQKTLTYSSHTKTYKNAARTVVRESVRSPELSAGQTWLFTDQQSGRLLYMSTSPGRSYDQSTTRQLSKITNAQRLAKKTATQFDECAIRAWANC